MKLIAELWDWCKTLVVALIIVGVLHFFVFNLSTVEGQSMEPTLTQDDWLFVNKLIYLMDNPDIGDVVILGDPYQEDSKDMKWLVKRVVGLPGDEIEITGKRLYRNGQLVDEPYTDTLIEDMSFGPVVVQKDHYFVMGDNRHANASLDSRRFQAVPREKIKGRADFVLWPLDDLRAL